MRANEIRALGNSVPAAAGRQRERALSLLAGRKGCVGGQYSESLTGMVGFVNKTGPCSQVLPRDGHRLAEFPGIG